MLTSAKMDQHYVTQMPRAQTPLAHTHARAASERWAMEECVKLWTHAVTPSLVSQAKSASPLEIFTSAFAMKGMKTQAKPVKTKTSVHCRNTIVV